MDQREFRDICGEFATGVTVITMKNENNVPVGMTANSFTSLSLDPPLIIFNIGKSASLYQQFMNTSYFAVNILSVKQEELSKQFSRKNIDRFSGVDFVEDVTGAPILKNTLAYFDCKVRELYDGGDHTIIVGEVKNGKGSEEQPLLFYKGKYEKIESQIAQK